MKTKLAVVVVSLVVGACADGAEGTDASVGSEREAIGGGTLVPETAGAPDTSVVKLEISQAGGAHLCSGIKIDARTFWTAASCLERAVANDQVRVTNNVKGTFFGTGSYTALIGSVDVHPSRKNYLLNTVEPRPLHYDIARLTLSSDTPNIPAYATTHPDWVAPNQSVTITAYGDNPQVPPFSGEKQYAWFSLIDSVAFDNATPYDAQAAAAIYARHMVANPATKPWSAFGDDGAPVFQKFGTIWKIIGILPADSADTKFVRYGNVRNWLAAPAVNLFQHDFRGFVFNKRTGRCIGTTFGGGNSIRTSECDGRFQDTAAQSWRLVAWGSQAGFFQLVNGSNNNVCLHAEASEQGWILRNMTCVVPGVGNVAQRWTFAATDDPNYRELRPGSHPGCATSQLLPGGVVEMATCANSDFQKWVMTR